MLTDELYYGFSKHENDSHIKRGSILHCLLIGLLMFCASLGCVLGILSQFGIHANYFLIMTVLFITAMFLSLIHISRFFYNAGYFLFMFVFSYALFTLRTYANSGYQALLNIVNEAYSDHYILSSVREYTEMIPDRYLTVTCVSIFLGLFLVLLLNVDIFSNMYYGTAFMLTFIPLQLGIFIGRYPSYFSLTLLFFSYFGIYLLRHSCHFYFVQPPKRKKKREYSFDYYDKKGKLIISHKSDAFSMLSVCIFALCASLIFSAFTTSVIKASENEALIRKSPLKESMDESVKILAQTGIMGLFNRYEAKGGISGGKLGGIRSVSPDYETDLEVTFVPYSFDTLYLKGYTSCLYTGSSWEAPKESTNYLITKSHDTGSRILNESHALDLMADDGIIDEAKARMKVKNIDAETGYVYTPYCLSEVPSDTICEPTSVLTGFSAKDGERTYDFVPYSTAIRTAVIDNKDRLHDLYDSEERQSLSEYEKEVYENYLQIPPAILNDLMSYHDSIGKADTVWGQAELIYDFFLKNYTYDMAPGATPYNKDFVTYFLKDQGRGFCAHFASAGTMLLRSYGIPARYVEGYVVTTSGISESASTGKEDPALYYTGINPLNNTTLVTTEVTDGDAHAWTEVYIDDFGWVPVEFTVPDDGTTVPSYADFLSSLSRLLDPAYIPDSDEESEGITPLKDFDPSGILNLNDFSAFNLFTGLILFLMFIPLFKRLYTALRDLSARRRAYMRGDYSLTLSHYYKRACRHLAGRDAAADPGLTEDCFRLVSSYIASGSKKGLKLKKFLDENSLTPDRVLFLTRALFYSDKKISRSEADLLIKFYKSI